MISMGLLSLPSTRPGCDLQHSCSWYQGPGISLTSPPTSSPCLGAILNGALLTWDGLSTSREQSCAYFMCTHPSNVVMLLNASQEPTNSVHVWLGGRGNCQAARSLQYMHAQAEGRQCVGRASHCMLPAACSLLHAPAAYLVAGTIALGLSHQGLAHVAISMTKAHHRKLMAVGKCKPSADGHGHWPTLALSTPRPPTSTPIHAPRRLAPGGREDEGCLGTGSGWG